MSEQQRYAHLFNQAPGEPGLRDLFASGKGVVELHPDLSDDVLLITIKAAIGMSEGKAFLVVPAGS